MNAGFYMMKYALNHPWKFTNYSMAYFAGLMQIVVVVAVEISVFYVLVFTTDKIFDTLANYAIVLVIADFGRNFTIVEGSAQTRMLILEKRYQKIFTWEVTTSSSACDKIPQNKLEEENILPAKDANLRPTFIFVTWELRSWGNRVQYLLYRVLVSLNNSFWYYFAPFYFN